MHFTFPCVSSDHVKTQSIRSYLGTRRRHRKFSFMSPSLPLIGDTRLAAIVDRLAAISCLGPRPQPLSPSPVFSRLHLLTTWKFPGYGVLIDDENPQVLNNVERLQPLETQKQCFFVIGSRASISSSGASPADESDRRVCKKDMFLALPRVVVMMNREWCRTCSSSTKGVSPVNGGCHLGSAFALFHALWNWHKAFYMTTHCPTLP